NTFVEAAGAGERPSPLMSYAAFSDIVKLCPAELFELAQAELGRCGCNGRLAGAVLAVGGLVVLAERMLGLPVRIGCPVVLGNMYGMLADPAFATVIGLVS